MKLFAGGIGTETNVWSPLLTGLDSFDIVDGDASQDARDRVTFGSTFQRYTARAAARGDSLVIGMYAFADPGGVTAQTAWTQLRDRLLAEISCALPLDAVVLTLHGAMTARAEPDCESDLLRRLRTMVGDDVTVGILLDLHCKLAADLVELSDVIVTFKEYPHVDVDDRAGELYDLVVAAAARDIDPVQRIFDCRMVGQYPTNAQPMRRFVDRLREVERDSGVLSVSLSHGFPSGDGETVTSRVLVVTDGDAIRGAALAEALGREFFSIRHEVGLCLEQLDDVLLRALNDGAGPVVAADVSDNPGSGAPGDSTFVLHSLLERDVHDAALGLLWDPVSVDIAFRAEIGDTLMLRLGGKAAAGSGPPIDVEAMLLGKTAELVQRWPQANGTAAPVPCGKAVWLRCGGVDVVANTRRTQVFGTEVFSVFDPELLTRRLLVVKSKQHFVAAFAPIARGIAYLASDGPVKVDVRQIPYQRFGRRAYPWLDDPWAVESEQKTSDTGEVIA